MRERQNLGKYATIDEKNPDAIGVCDTSGFVFNHKDLVKQMEWYGDNFVWTGYMVGKPFVDIPAEQNRPPLTKDDPRPVKNARPFIGEETVPPAPELTFNQIIASLKSARWGI